LYLLVIIIIVIIIQCQITYAKIQQVIFQYSKQDLRFPTINFNSANIFILLCHVWIFLMNCYSNNIMIHSLYSYIVIWMIVTVKCILIWHVYFVFLYYPMTSSISNGYQTLYGFDKRIINYYYKLYRRGKSGSFNW
jgi:hypothetical protein